MNKLVAFHHQHAETPFPFEPLPWREPDCAVQGEAYAVCDLCGSIDFAQHWHGMVLCIGCANEERQFALVQQPYSRLS